MTKRKQAAFNASDYPVAVEAKLPYLEFTLADGRNIVIIKGDVYVIDEKSPESYSLIDEHYFFSQPPITNIWISELKGFYKLHEGVIEYGIHDGYCILNTPISFKGESNDYSLDFTLPICSAEDLLENITVVSNNWINVGQIILAKDSDVAHVIGFKDSGTKGLYLKNFKYKVKLPS